MSGMTARQLATAYVTDLRGELAALGAAEADDLAAEILSLLTDAAGDDAVRMAAETRKLGAPADLAAEILAEKGLGQGGIATPDWWRMGVAVPLDIVIGIAVPVATAVPAYAVGRQTPLAAAVATAALLASLAWPWLVWRPWRTGGPAVSPGMALTGIAVVRAPGRLTVANASDLARTGLQTHGRGLAIALAVGALLAVVGSAAWSVAYLS